MESYLIPPTVKDIREAVRSCIEEGSLYRKHWRESAGEEEPSLTFPFLHAQCVAGNPREPMRTDAFTGSVYPDSTVTDEHRREMKEASVQQRFRGAMAQRWAFGEEQGPQGILVDLPSVKVYCKSKGCKSVESLVSEPTHSRNILPDSGEGSGEAARIEGIGVGVPHQVFALHYQCARCGRKDFVFVLERRKDFLRLVGRTPISRIEIPTYIPEEIQDHYSRALLSAKTGFWLGGKIYLRAALEIHARTYLAQLASLNLTLKEDQRQHRDVIAKYEQIFLGTKDTEGLFDSYKRCFPEAWRQEFPMLNEIFDDLSSDLHEGLNSEGCFKKAQADFERHFDSRRLYEPATPPS